MNNGHSPEPFLKGRIQVRQDDNGYRFSIDAVLLAAHVRVRPGERVLDLGTGCGIIPLLLTGRHPDITVTGVEIQSELASMAEENAIRNGMEARIRIIPGDMKTLTAADIGGPVDIVVSNPPYRKADSGRVNPNRQRAAARHEIHITLDELTAAAGRMLRAGGRFFLVYPTERLPDLLAAMRARRLEPKWMRCIHSRPCTESRLVLVEGAKDVNPGLRVDRPLFVYRNKKEYTDEVDAMLHP